MENSVSFKSVYWRLLLWRFIPFYIGWLSVDLIYKSSRHFPITLTSLLLSACALFIGVAIGTLLTQKKFHIEISSGLISGPSGEIFLSSKTIPVSQLEKIDFGKQSFYERISGFYTIRSRNGSKIVFTPFIYDPLTKDKIQKVLRQNLLVEQSMLQDEIDQGNIS